MVLIKGITITLIQKTSNGFDDFGQPKFTETQVNVDNVLVAEPSTDDITNDLTIYGKMQAYTLGIPKGDTHNWEDTEVIINGKRFRTYGNVIEGIEAMMPLDWHKKIKVERYE